MNYYEAREYLEQISVTGSILGLETIRHLMAKLDDPQDKLRIVHLAGTNGKGSIQAFVVSMLRAAGYKVGSYISPSVMGYLEKFQLNGEWMKEEELAPLVEQVKAAADSMVSEGAAMPTIFEFETAIAFLWFVQQGCDYVILETGLGGDLDSTNVVANTEVCAFASISLDHTGMLGNSIEEIAEKKAGIIKSGSTVVTGWQNEGAEEVLERKAEELGCEIRRVDKQALVIEGKQEFSYKGYKGLRTEMLGSHQFENAATAIEVLEALRARGAQVSDASMREGIAAARWAGRFEILHGRDCDFILDGAHNPAAATKLREALEQFYPNEKIHAVFGIFRDKDYITVIETIAPLLADVQAVTLPNTDRALHAKSVREIFADAGTKAVTAESIESAIDSACETACADGGAVLVTGSLSHLGQAKKYIETILGNEGDYGK